MRLFLIASMLFSVILNMPVTADPFSGDAGMEKFLDHKSLKKVKRFHKHYGLINLDFDRRYQAIEKKFSPLPAREKKTLAITAITSMIRVANNRYRKAKKRHGIIDEIYFEELNLYMFRRASEFAKYSGAQEYAALFDRLDQIQSQYIMARKNEKITPPLSRQELQNRRAGLLRKVQTFKKITAQHIKTLPGPQKQLAIDIIKYLYDTSRFDQSKRAHKGAQKYRVKVTCFRKNPAESCTHAPAIAEKAKKRDRVSLYLAKMHDIAIFKNEIHIRMLWEKSILGLNIYLQRAKTTRPELMKIVKEKLRIHFCTSHLWIEHYRQKGYKMRYFLRTFDGIRLYQSDITACGNTKDPAVYNPFPEN